MPQPIKIEPWPVHGGFRIAHTQWVYEVSGYMEGYDQRWDFDGLPAVTWLTEDACLQAIGAMQ